MTNHDDLLKAITANPDDDTLRLAYADFLQEHEEYGGEPLAQAIRVGLECGRTVMYRNDGFPVPDDPPAQYRDEWFSKWPAPSSREFITAYEGVSFALKWFLPPPQARSRCEVRLHRGFPAELTVPAKWWLEHADTIVKKCPALTVKPYFDADNIWDYLDVYNEPPTRWAKISIKNRSHMIDRKLGIDFYDLFLELCRLEWPEVLAFTSPHPKQDIEPQHAME